MKRILQLSMAAAACSCVDAALSLRGEGIEEVGEQIEHFPPEEIYVDRRILTVGPEQSERDLQKIEAFDKWPDKDVVGNIVNDEDEWYVHKFPARSKKSSACDAPDESEFRIRLTTDRYGYETKWKLLRVGGGDRKNNRSNGLGLELGNSRDSEIASGPREGTNYADTSIYSGRWCLGPGRYNFQLIDNGRDGICSENKVFGCGELRLWLDGESAGQMIKDTSDWVTKNFFFDVEAADGGIIGRIDGVDPVDGDGDGEWCAKVRSVMQVPPGTCSLPNGQRGHRVRVTTKVDKYGTETSWAITTRRFFISKKQNGWDFGDDNDRNNNHVSQSSRVRMKMGPVVPPNGKVSVEDCLPPGKYNIRFEDFDGICCRHGEGFFELIVDGELLLDGGSFTRAIEHDFQMGLDWISTMDERDCEWWWAHDYRRRDWHTRCYDGQYCNKSYRHLKWSAALAEDAKVYADELLETCDTVGILHDPTNMQGENLAKNKGSGAWGAIYPADKVTKRFVDNEEFWGWNGNAHLTQAMWYSSRYLGCGESVKHMGGAKYCRMQVCRFVKAGNCQMSKFNSAEGNNWMTPMMADDSPCGPMCPSRDGCFH